MEEKYLEEIVSYRLLMRDLFILEGKRIYKNETDYFEFGASINIGVLRLFLEFMRN